MDRSDQDLVGAVLAGDRAAFDGLYDRHAPLIRAICFDSTQSLVDAQDLAQEAFLRAYRKLHELRDPERFRSWLIRIAQWVCKEWRRSRSRDRHRYVGLDLSELVHTDSSEDGADTLHHLQLAIAALPEKERLAVHLSYLQEQPAEQARQLIGLSRSGLYRVLQRARRRLEAAMSEREEVE